MALNRLYFITMDDAQGEARGESRAGERNGSRVERRTPLEQIGAACRAGVRLLQLRMKEASDEEFYRTALAAKEICGKYDCCLILNDRVEIAAAVGADGVHVGKEDVSVREARRIMGKDRIVGGTANTIEDIREHYRGGADYVGVGPYRFTTTKKKLSPILGLEGYHRIRTQMSEEGIPIPLFAIGGIELEDMGPLLDAGVYGVAFSGLLVQSAEWLVTMKQMGEKILKTI